MAVLSVITYSFSLSLIPANAAVKAGSACKTAGVTSIASGKTFTCIKSGNKLVWNKGIKVVASKTTKPVQKLNFIPWSDKFETTLMTETALNNTDAFFGKVTPSNSFEITIDPAINSSDRVWITRALEYTNGAFLKIDKEKIRVFVGASHDWSLKTLRNANIWIGNPSSPFPCSQGFSDAYCADRNLVLLIFSDLYTPNTRYSWDVGRRSTPAHEIFHTVQFALAGPNVDKSDPSHIPRWLMEGSANFYGYYVVEKLGFDKYQSGRDQQITYNTSYSTYTALSDYDNFSLDPYGIGQAASEYLIASIGFEKFLNIWKFTKTESSFIMGFKKATGITIEEFYAKFESARSSMRIGS